MYGLKYEINLLIYNISFFFFYYYYLGELNILNITWYTWIRIMINNHLLRIQFLSNYGIMSISYCIDTWAFTDIFKGTVGGAKVIYTIKLYIFLTK